VIGIRQVAGAVLRRLDQVGEHLSVARDRRRGVRIVGRNPTAALVENGKRMSHGTSRRVRVVDPRTRSAGAQSRQIDGADQNSIDVVVIVRVLQIVGDPHGLVGGGGVGRSRARRTLPQARLRIVRIVIISVGVGWNHRVQIVFEGKPAECGRSRGDVLDIADRHAHVVMTVAWCSNSLLHDPQVVHVVVQELGIWREGSRAVWSIAGVVAVLAPGPGIGLGVCATEESYRLIRIGAAFVPALVGAIDVLAIFKCSDSNRYIRRGRWVLHLHSRA